MVEKSGIDMSEAARMQRAKDMGYDLDFPLTHGSYSEQINSIDKKRFKGDPSNIFDGLFAAKGDEAVQGDFGHTFYPRVGRVADHGDWDLDYETSMNVLRNEYPKATDEQLDMIYDMSAGDKEVSSMDFNPLEDHGFSNISDASWEGQRLRGKIAAEHDFDAIAMKDEYGTSYLIPHGTKARKKEAIFSPLEKDSSNILAGIAGVGGVGLAASVAPSDSYAEEQKPASFVNSLHNMVMQAEPTSREILIAQRRREDYLAKIDQLNKQDKSVQVPQSNMASKAADYAARYNQARKEKLAPGLDLVLPVGELPEDYLRKLSYGDEVTLSDRMKAGLGMF